MHVKNIRWEQTPAGRWRWRFDELADGQCDWAEAIAALRAAGYDGWLSLENLWRVPVRHTGYVDEDLADASLPPRDIDQRLRDDSRCCAASALRRPRLGPRSPARLPSLR